MNFVFGISGRVAPSMKAREGELNSFALQIRLFTVRFLMAFKGLGAFGRVATFRSSKSVVS